MKCRTLLLLGLAASVAFAAVAPAAAQGNVDPQELARRFPEQPTPTKLWFHINGFQEFPINTQQPDDRYKSNAGFGPLAHSNDCLDDLTGLGQQQPLLDQDFHTIYGYVSPSYVEYAIEEGGQPRIHQERGIAYNVELVGEEFTLTWFIETQVAPGNSDLPMNSAPVHIPNVVVMATMRAGDAISVGNEAYNDGPVIASGYAGPFHLAGGATQQVNQAVPGASTRERAGGVNYTSVDGGHVYGFTVPMRIEPAMSVIPRADGANLRIDVFMENPACETPEDGYVMPNFVRTHSSLQARPHIDLVVNNPIMIPYLHPQFVAGDLIVHTQLNSPWGNYDVDEQPGGIEVSITNLDLPGVTAKTLKRESFVQHALDHNKHQDAVDVTYLWDFEAEGAPDGVYEVLVRVQNDQKTAWAEGRSKFQIGKSSNEDLPACDPDIPIDEQANCIQVAPDSSGKASPGAGMLAAGLLVGLAAVLRRRKA